jgi:hypothetical protein
MRQNRMATVWISVAEIRISDRRRRSLSDAKVELYRQRLEQGLEPTAGAARSER